MDRGQEQHSLDQVGSWTSLQMGCSASVSQNSQASGTRSHRGPESSAACTEGGVGERLGQAVGWRPKPPPPQHPPQILHGQVYLDDAMHVGDEPVNPCFQQHHWCTAHVLPHLRVIVTARANKCRSGPAAAGPSAFPLPPQPIAYLDEECQCYPSAPGPGP